MSALPTWLDEAVDWAAGHGVALDGPVVVAKTRPWSTVLRLPTGEGWVYLKAPGPGTAYEGALLQAFAGYGVPHVPRPLAVHPERGWLLLPDGGRTLREALVLDPGRASVEWEVLLPRYAALQRAVEGLPLPGLPDRTPVRLPGLLDGLLSTVPVDPDLLPDLRRLEPRFAGWCSELADVPPTVQHDDLHGGNVFVQRGAHVVFDWGDACLAVPFASLLVVQRSLSGRIDLRRLRDCYLEAWTDRYSRAELELLALLATRVGKVGRVLAWQRALAGATDAGRAEHADAVAGWLEELLEPDVF